MTKTAATRKPWTLTDKGNDTTTVHVQVHDGFEIFRLRTAGWNDSFVTVRDGRKLGTAASVAQARKLAN